MIVRARAPLMASGNEDPDELMAAKAPPDDPIAVHVDAHDRVHLVAGAKEEERFATVRVQLATRRRHEFVPTLGTTEQRSLQRSGSDRVGSVLDLEARIFQRRRVEQQRGQTMEKPPPRRLNRAAQPVMCSSAHDGRTPDTTERIRPRD
jgi:hypothetical protein